MIDIITTYGPQLLVVYGAICALATAAAPLFPPGSKTAKVLNWIGSQLRKG